ncbi:uncharacterized protein LOC108669347 isoform X2 [Hyalella azteca]|nr:uncharacterized protein LOC108669347 isoform X2 [Hyalella azteca]
MLSAVLWLALASPCFSASLTQRQFRQFGGVPQLQGSINNGYLPPRPTSGPGTCQQSTAFVTSTQYSNQVVTSTIYSNGGGQIITQTVFSTQFIPTTFFSNLISTIVVNSGQIQTQFITITITNTRTQFVTQPGGISFVTSTQFVDVPQIDLQTRFITRTVQIPSTGVTTVFSTTVIPQQVVSTIFNSQFVTRTMIIPGQTRTVVSTLFSTIFSTVSIPGQTIFQTQTIFSTNFIPQTITLPGATRTVVSTVIQPVFTTIFSTVFSGNIQTSFVTSTQYDNRVITSTIVTQVNNFNTRTVTVPQVSTSVVIQNQVTTSTGFTQVVIPTFVTVSGGNGVVTVTRTVVSTQVIPGSGQTVFVTRTVFSTSFITSTVFNTNVQTTVITITQPCSGGGTSTGGYNYTPPRVAFNPFN